MVDDMTSFIKSLSELSEDLLACRFFFSSEFREASKKFFSPIFVIYRVMTLGQKSVPQTLPLLLQLFQPPRWVKDYYQYL